MFNLSLSQAFIRKVFLPTSLQHPSKNTTTPFRTIPPELWDRIIDELYDDRRTLLALGCTSRQTLVRSRHHLFSKLEFTKFEAGDADFDALLTLLEAPWTSFTTVESLYFKEQFPPRRLARYQYHPTRNIPLIAANLPNLKTLRVTSTYWPRIPAHICDLFFQFNLTNFQLDSVELAKYPKIDLVEIFLRIPPSVKSITLYNVKFISSGIPDIPYHSYSTFLRQIHLDLLDSCSLLLFRDVWDPLSSGNLDVTVESFHLRLGIMTGGGYGGEYIPFISRFLQNVGPSFHHLSIKLSEPFPSVGSWLHYSDVDLSRCINVCSLHIGIIELDRAGDKMLPMLDAMWTSLSNFASNSPPLHRIVLVFQPCDATQIHSVAAVQSFGWLDLVERLQDIFPRLTRIVIGLGYYAQGRKDVTPHITALRQARGIHKLEEDGTVVVEPIPWKVDVAENGMARLQTCAEMYPLS